MSESPELASLERHLQLVPEQETSRRGVGVIRVSRLRDDAKSPGEQRARLVEYARRNGVELVAIFEEPSVSGRKTPLAKRPGLLPAIEMVEDGEADEILVAYFDRLVRNIAIQQEIVERVTKAGGKLYALDIGDINHATAARWVELSILGVIGEYTARMSDERSSDSKYNAVASGIAPHRLPPGYVRGADQKTYVDEAAAEAVAEGFRLRAAGATVREVRTYLREHGIVRNHKAVSNLLANRFYLGELHFGKFGSNLHAHVPLIDAATFRAAQSTASPRGRQPKSERLLARLGVLRCGLCETPMQLTSTVVGGRRYPFYRCQADDCPHVTISAPLAEEHLWEVTRAENERAQNLGRASSDEDVERARLDLERLQGELDDFVFNIQGARRSLAIQERIAAMQDEVDEAAARHERLSTPSRTRKILAADDATLAGKRELIRLAIDRALVMPGRGTDRIVIELSFTP